ncbi:MAG: metallophosphoesterase family protein, partial [Spirochaetota bacterium]
MYLVFMRIAHITDMHIGRPGEYVDDVDVCTNFINVLSSVTDYGVDHIVLGGDLCYRDALPETYEWIYERIVESSLPFSITPGNHDDTDLLGKVFSIGTFDSVYTIGSVPVLFLDTAHAQLSGEQLKNADDTIQRHNIRTVFMHHPPALCHVPHMDAKYPLVNHDEVLGLFVKRGIRHVFC